MRSNATKPPLILTVGLGLCFIVWSMLVAQGHLVWFDREGAAWLKSIGYSDFMIELVSRLTHLGAELTIYFIIAAIFIARLPRQRVERVRLLAVTVGASLLYRLFKLWFHRPRPSYALVAASGFSYPSGHAVMATAFYGLIIIMIWWTAGSRTVKLLFSLMLAAVIVIVAWSRVYLNVHYPSDVVAGMLLGAFWLSLITGWGDRRGY